MADGSFPGLVSKDRDVNAVTNPIWVNLSDGTNAYPVGGGVEAAALRVTIANDSTGLLSVDDNGGSLTIDNSTLAVVGGGTEATALRVTIANDSTGLLSIDDGGSSITVDGTVAISGTVATNYEYAEDTAHVTADVGVQVLVVRNDTLASLVSADGDYAPLQVNADGALYVSGTFAAADVKVDDSAFAVGTDSVGVSGYLADETTPDSVDEGDVGAARMTLDRKQIMVIADATTDSQRLAIDASGLAQVDVAAHALTNANALPISKDNSANAEANPIYVYNVANVVSGTEVHDYDTAAAIASDATSDHDYAVTGTTFFLKSVIVAGSGNIKFEVQGGPTAGPTTIAVGFLTGRQGDTQQLFFDPPVEVLPAATGVVRIIRTNRQGAATDLYSTIIGSDV